MGNPFGLPEWLFATLFAGLGFAIIAVAAWRNTHRQISQTLGRRPSPTKEEFLAEMSRSTSPEAAEFLWSNAIAGLDLFDSGLTPHPDDDLAEDLPIDEDEWSMDWPGAWAKLQGWTESDIPDWPDSWPPTLRNYGRWLDMLPMCKPD